MFRICLQLLILPVVQLSAGRVSGAANGFVGRGVWAHHMFAFGPGPISVAVFAISTMAVAVPTGVETVNWTLTMWGRKLHFTTAKRVRKLPASRRSASAVLRQCPLSWVGES